MMICANVQILLYDMNSSSSEEGERRGQDTRCRSRVALSAARLYPFVKMNPPPRSSTLRPSWRESVAGYEFARMSR